jgi:hypothetical protein
MFGIKFLFKNSRLFFECRIEQFNAIPLIFHLFFLSLSGVADGVGGWQKYGIGGAL